jgi:hypothetical protein
MQEATPEHHRRELAPPSKLEGEPLPSRTSLRSPPTLETPLGEFAVLRRPRRTKNHQEMGFVASALLAPTRSAMAPLHRPIRATAALLIAVSHLFHHVWLGLHREYPFVYIKS